MRRVWTESDDMARVEYRQSCDGAEFAQNSPVEPKTTTVSTIVVKAGTEAFITVGLLQVKSIFD